MKKIILLLIVLAILLGGFYTYNSIYSPVDSSNSESISVNIKKGSSVKEVASALKEDGLIKNEFIFYIFARSTGSDKNIIAGRYNLNKGMNVPQIIEQISIIGSSESTLTVQEGLTIADIDDKLAGLDVISDGDFEEAVRNFDNYNNYWFLDSEKQKSLEMPLEGYLYPDTYFIDTVDFSAEDLIEKMLNNFENKFDPVREDFNAQKRQVDEIITMASILQREVRTPEDYNIVSGILWKRLDSNWHIGADATILYATKKKTVEAADLDFDSPYNTRLYTGMPPGPICNPDIEHIKAAITPEDSDFWYYLTTLDTGEVIYAKTNDEQNINKAKYLY